MCEENLEENTKTHPPLRRDCLGRHSTRQDIYGLINSFAYLIMLLILVADLTACSSRRKIIPTGEVPRVAPVSAYDEEYGQQVLEAITQDARLDNSSQRINRVRAIVDRLTWAANSDSAPWHVYVIDAPQIKNAGATRGNFVFVWSGILDAVRDDSELAAVLAHEIGHVLARHVMPDPGEMANQMISGVAGTVGRVVVENQPGAISMASGVAEALISSTVDALIVNPQSQRLEYEADEIGIFLMADAGYAPEAAINFWGRAKDNLDFGGGSPQFSSSHPSSENRLNRLKKVLPEAQSRFLNNRFQELRDGRDFFQANREYRSKRGGDTNDTRTKNAYPHSAGPRSAYPRSAGHTKLKPGDSFSVESAQLPSRATSPTNPTRLHRPNQSSESPNTIAIFLHPDDRLSPIGYVRENGDIVATCRVNPDWLHVSGEQYGYAKSTELKILSDIPICP